MSKKKGARHDAAIGVVQLLSERFPAAFGRLDTPWKHRPPLKLGIREDIIAAMPDIAPAQVGLALAIYTGHSRYLKTCEAGVARVDLAGEVCGVVTEQEAAFAKKRRTKTKARRAAETLPAPPLPSPTPKRLSLNDLRAAAAQRVGMNTKRPHRVTSEAPNFRPR